MCVARAHREGHWSSYTLYHLVAYDPVYSRVPLVSLGLRPIIYTYIQPRRNLTAPQPHYIAIQLRRYPTTLQSKRFQKWSIPRAPNLTICIIGSISADFPGPCRPLMALVHMATILILKLLSMGYTRSVVLLRGHISRV